MQHSTNPSKYSPHYVTPPQFTATSYSRAKDTLPSLIIAYDVSPIEAPRCTRDAPEIFIPETPQIHAQDAHTKYTPEIDAYIHSSAHISV